MMYDPDSRAPPKEFMDKLARGMGRRMAARDERKRPDHMTQAWPIPAKISVGEIAPAAPVPLEDPRRGAW